MEKYGRDKGLILYTEETEFIARQIYETMKSAASLLSLEYKENPDRKDFTAVQDGSGFTMLKVEELKDNLNKRFVFAFLPIITYTRSTAIQVDTVLQHALVNNVRYYDRNGTIYEPSMTYKSLDEEEEN